MPKKLFSVESDNPNDMLIDKILLSRQKNQEGLPLTAELLQQRQTLKKEIKDALDEPPKEEDDDTSDDTDKKEDDQDTSDNTRADKDNKSDDSQDTTKKEDKGDESDDADEHVDTAQSVDDLEASIGSAKSSGKGKGGENDKTALESFKEPVIKLRTLFRGVQQKHQSYVDTLKMFSLESDALSPAQQPVVYVKEEVVKSIHALIGIAHDSVTKNAKLVELAKEAAKKAGERLAVYHTCISQELLSFTNEVVSDPDLLQSFSTQEQSDPYKTAVVLAEYLDTSSTLALMIAKSPIESLGDALTSNGFSGEGLEYSYGKQLPGFNEVKAGLTPYKNYIDVKYEDYQVYRLRTFKPRQLQSLDGVSITKDNDLNRLLGVTDKILVSLGLSVDDLNTVNDTYLNLIDKLKSVVYDVENNTLKDLSSIGLDEHMKDFIRFRLMTDIYTLNANMSSEYLSAVLSLLGVISSLREPKA